MFSKKKNIKGRILSLRPIVGATLGVASLIAYSITLAPDVLAHDSGEWQAAGSTLGISHPPGSPAYILVSWLFSLVHLGTPAARVNFVSAVMGAAGVVAVYILMLTLLDRLLPAIVTALTLSVAALWWSFASVATPYNGVPLVMVLLLILLLLWRKSGNIKFVLAGALIAGLGASWHPSLLFFLPVPLAGAFILGPWRKLAKPSLIIIVIGLFFAGLSPYLYLPIRSATNPPVEYSKVDSGSSFIKFISAGEARERGQGSLRVPETEKIRDRFVEVIRQSYFPSYAFLVFGPAIILFYPAVWPRLRPLRLLLAFLFTSMLAHIAIVFFLSGGGEFSQYYLPLLIYFSIWAGFSVYLVMVMGEVYLPQGRIKYLPAVLAGVLFAGVLAIGIPRIWDFVNHRNDYSLRSYIEAVDGQAKPGSVVLADWNTYPGFLYVQKVEGWRLDLKVYPVTYQEWRSLLPRMKSENPGSPILLSFALIGINDRNVTRLTQPFPLSIKGRTYQDDSHGEPLPTTVALFEVQR